MGNNPSITDQQKQELWNRDISHLFTAAKIVPIQLYSASFVQTITTKGDENENLLICMFCNDGKIRGILYSSKSSSFSSSLFLTIVAESQNLFPPDQNDNPSNSNNIYHFTSVVKLSDKYIAVTLNNGSIFSLSAREKQSQESNSDENKKTYFEFDVVTFPFPNNQTQSEKDNSFIDLSSCIVKYTNDTFIAIDHEMTAALCKFDGSIQIIWDGTQLQTNKIQTKEDTRSSDNQFERKRYFFSNSSYCCATVYSNYLFAVHFSHDGTWKGLIYGIVKEKISPMQSFEDDLKSIITMEAHDNGIFCLCDLKSENINIDNADETGRFSVISIDIDKNQIIKSLIKEINKNVNNIVDFKVIDNKKTLLCLSENSIITYTPDLENHVSIETVNNAGSLEFVQLASLSSQHIFSVFSSSNQEQPNIYILRVSKKSRKTFLELFPINVKLSEGTIEDCCPVDDFTFITLSTNGELVLYESLPDWWDVPYFMNIFDDKQQH